jgi:cell wall-associated NlpC family hydrolase
MDRRRERVGRAAAVALAMTVLPVVLPTPAGADPISDQQAVVAKVTDQLEALSAKADELAEDYSVALDEQHQLDIKIADARQRVAEQQAAVDALRDQLAHVAVQAYMGAGTSGASPVFNSTADVTDSLARDQLSRVAESAGTATTDQYDEAVEALQHEQDALGTARDQASAKASQIQGAKQANDRQQAAYAKARDEAQAKLGDLVQQEEERRARESYLKQQAAEEAAARQRAAEAQVAAEQQTQAAAAAQQAAAQQAAAQQAAAQQAAAAARAPGATTPATTPTTATTATTAGATTATTATTAAPANVRAVEAPDPPPDVPAASSRAAIAVQAALSQVGVPYIAYKATPGVGFDCSGLTMWAWAQAGVSLPHQSRQQYGTVAHVPHGDAQPGDLLFFHSPISHVTIYLGNGQMVSAPHTGAAVRVSTVNWNTVVGVGRPG